MSEIWNNITSTEDGRAKYDETLKELLANKQFLSRIMKRFVTEFKDYPIEDIENKYIEADSVSVSRTGVERNRTNIEGLSNEDVTLNEGRVYYDIIFKACYPGQDGRHIGLYINVEAQNAYYNGYPIEMRGLYYAARRFGSQLKSIRHDTNYGCLQKVYSIWICMGDVPNKEANSATLYQMVKHDIIGHVIRDPKVYDLIDVIILRINDQTEPEDEVLGLLRVLCSNLIKKDDKLKQMSKYGIQIKDVEEGVSRMCNLSELVEKRGEARGELRGELRGETKILLKMLQNGMTYETVAEYAEVSVETLKEWEEKEKTSL